MRLIDFFDDEADLERCLALASDEILPIIDQADALADPGNHTKISTALFILFTHRAVKNHGLTPPVAHKIIDELLAAIEFGTLDSAPEH
jgi:hypothetical protein